MGYSTYIEKSPSRKKSSTCLVSNPTKYHHYYHNQVWVCVCVYVWMRLAFRQIVT